MRRLILVIVISLGFVPTAPSCCSGGEPEVITRQGIRLVRIPAGEFLMGGIEGDPLTRPNELPQHLRKIDAPYYLGETEITVKQFRKFVEATGYETTAEKRPSDATWRHMPLQHSKAEFPVRNVSWLDAQAFCNWLNKSNEGVFRLPTEVEWEFACRAGKEDQYYYFGNDIEKLKELAWVGTAPGDTFPPGTESWREIKREQPCPVKQFPKNPYGLFGMHGNVSEWTNDQYRLYLDEEESTTESKPYRGGNYSMGGPVFARCSNRSWMHEEYYYSFVGFRVVWEPNPTAENNPDKKQE